MLEKDTNQVNPKEFSEQDHSNIKLDKENKGCLLGFKECPLKPVKRKIVGLFRRVFK